MSKIIQITNNPKEVILHCADTPDYEETDSRFDAIGVQEIRDWHLKRITDGEPWEDVAYHYIVRRTGAIEAGRPTSVIGAHCKGHNKDSIGVCWVGRSKPTAYQLNSLKRLHLNIMHLFNIHWDNWSGHSEYNPNKLCPGIDMTMFRLLLANNELAAGQT